MAIIFHILCRVHARCCSQRLHTAKTLIAEGNPGTPSIDVDFGVDMDGCATPSQASTARHGGSTPAPAEAVAGSARLVAENKKLRFELEHARQCNVDLHADLEYAMSMLSDQRYFDTPTPLEIDERTKSRPSPSAMLVEMLSSAVTSWKAKVRCSGILG